MWRRWLWLVIYWAPFAWIAVFFGERGSWAAVIVPCLALAAMIIARDRIAEKDPRLRVVGVTFGILVVLFALQRTFRETLPETYGLWPRVRQWADRGAAQRVSEKTDSSLIELRRLLNDYNERDSLAEVANLRKRIDELLAKRESGKFGAAEEALKKQLVDDVKKLAANRADMQRVIAELESTGVAPSGSMPQVPAPDERGTSSDGRSGSQSSSHPVHPQPPNVRSVDQPAKLAELQSLINRLPEVSGTRIAIVLRSDRVAGTPVSRTLYTALRQRDERIASDAIQEVPFIERGFFEEVDRGQTRNLVGTTFFDHSSHLIVGNIIHHCTKGAAVDPELISCRLDATVKLVDRTGAIVRSDVFSSVAAGYTESGAVSAASDHLAEVFDQKMLRLVH